MITTGGGYGRLSFYDLRAQQYLYLPPESNSEKSLALDYRKTGVGWLVCI